MDFAFNLSDINADYCIKKRSKRLLGRSTALCQRVMTVYKLDFSNEVMHKYLSRKAKFTSFTKKLNPVALGLAAIPFAQMDMMMVCRSEQP
jgi:hypothetical protein